MRRGRWPLNVWNVGRVRRAAIAASLARQQPVPPTDPGDGAPSRPTGSYSWCGRCHRRGRFHLTQDKMEGQSLCGCISFFREKSNDQCKVCTAYCSPSVVHWTTLVHTVWDPGRDEQTHGHSVHCYLKQSVSPRLSVRSACRSRCSRRPGDLLTSGSRNAANFWRSANRKSNGFRIPNGCKCSSMPADTHRGSVHGLRLCRD